MRLRLAPYLRKPPPIFASGKHFVQLYHWQTSHTQERYTQFKKYFSKMLNEDRLSKKGINLIFSKINEGDNCVFFRFATKTIYL